jgi:hypothetical protein
MQYQTQGYIISEGEDIACALENLTYTGSLFQQVMHGTYPV